MENFSAVLPNPRHALHARWRTKSDTFIYLENLGLNIKLMNMEYLKRRYES